MTRYAQESRHLYLSGGGMECPPRSRVICDCRALL